MTRRYRRHRLSFSERINLNPDISRGLLAILIIIIGCLSALSFFDLAGVFGQFIDALLALGFGQVRYCLGYWGGIIILSGIILISVIFLFNTSLAKIVELHKKLFLLFGWFGKK